MGLIDKKGKKRPYIEAVGLLDGSGETVDVQHPLPTDGDSVYVKDIKTSLDDIGTFTGSISSLFNNLDDVIVDSSATEPKYFEFFLERPINNGTFGLNTSSGDFSNVKIILKNRQNVIVFTHDDSANNTKYTNKSYDFTTRNFCCIRIEFHTTDEVNLSGLFIPKNHSVSIDKIDGLISMINSTETTLSGDEVFTGEAVDTKDYGMAIVSAYSDVSSATDGLSIQFSKDKINWFWSDSYTLAASSGKTWSVQTQARWMRVVFTNGSSPQAIFQLETTLKPVYVKPSSHRIADSVSGQDDSELVKAVLTAENPNNEFINIGATSSNNLKIANAEDTINIARGNVVGYSSVHKFGRGANINTSDGFVDLWDGAEYDNALKTYTFSSTADIDRISSNNAGDTQEIEIQGLDSNWELVTQTKTLTGRTPVALDTPLIRVFRMINIDSVDFAGIIFCFVNVATTGGVPNTITNVRAIVNNGNNQTLMSIYTVPTGVTAYIVSWYAALSSAKASSFCNLEMKARPFNGIFQLKHTSTLSSAGTSHVQHVYHVEQAFPEKTDFIMKSDSSVNDNAVSAGFDLILIDDNF